MHLDDLSDAELVVRFRAAADAKERDQSLNELFRRHYARVARWCLRFVPNRESAADLTQEIFTKAYQNLEKFQGQCKFSTWLFVIARNHCLNAVRANARKAAEVNSNLEIDEGLVSATSPSAADPASSLEREADSRLISDLLTQVLNETERKVFALHYGEELPLDTITRLLNLENASGAKAYIVSAKRKLARVVQRWKLQTAATPRIPGRAHV